MSDVKLTSVALVLLTCIIEVLSNFRDSQFLSAKSPEKFPAATFIELVERYGYPAEEHNVTTSDGYKLRIHRIPGSPSQPKSAEKSVVYIQHGVLSSSPSFVLAGPNKDLAFILADAGYDVWMGNARGNAYSRAHVRWSPDNDRQFWDFSFHEIALYDLPATIDYILNKTEQKSLVYIGHSMGSTVSLILLSTKPEYNEKINLVINLATVGNWKNPHNVMRMIRDNGPLIKVVLLAVGIGEVLPQSQLNIQLSTSTCSDDSTIQPVCIGFIQYLCGYNPDVINSTLYAEGLTYYPSGASRKIIFHFQQNMVAGRLQMYDYGLVKNLALYRHRTPPAYNLKNIETPIFLIYGKGDAIADPEDSLDLEKILKNARAESVPHEQFNHADFLWGKNIKSLLQDRILEIIKESTKSARTGKES